MAKPNFTVSIRQSASGEVRLVEFDIPGGVTTAPEFSEAVEGIEKELPGPTPVFFSGRGPVWGYGMLIHAAHPTPATGTYDPRLGFIVVATHDVRFPRGSVLEELKEAEASL